jgi:hypothetical protein
MSNRAPSVEALHEVYLAVCDFLVQRNTRGYGTIWEREHYLLLSFGRLSDALRPVRNLIATGSLEGWEQEVKLALRETVKSFDRIVKAWGWGRVADPEPRRSDYVTKRRKRFCKEVEQPFFGAALAIKEGCRTLRESHSLDGRVNRWAEEGRRRGFASTMTPKEGKASFTDLQEKWVSTPMIGTRELEIEADVRVTIGLAIRTLNRALVAVLPVPNADPVEKLSVKQREDLLREYGPLGAQGIKHLREQEGMELAEASGSEHKPPDAAPPPSTPEAAAPPAVLAPEQPAAPASADPVRELRRQGKPNRAALVEYMRDRDSATYEEIAKHVHGDNQTSEATIRKNVERTNEELAAMASPTRYHCASSMVHKKTSPE